MSYSSRVYRQRNPHMHENDANKEQSSFFSKSNDQASSKGSNPSFFQAKLSVGQPNDKYEQEADAVANSVVNHRQGNVPVVQQKEISSIQRYATPLEEEKYSTNDERMKHDKEIQEKPEVQMMCAGCEKEKEKKGAVQKKADGGGTASPQLSSKIESASGKGKKLPRNTLAEMNNSFGVDFSKVNIHTDSESTQMNKELGAQAFTHGSDIYFNSGKYNNNTAEGKQLLAHELTHVVQQGYAPEEKHVQRDLLDDLNPFKEDEESVAGAVAGVTESTPANTGGALSNQQTGNDLPGSFLGDIVPIPLSLPAWKTDFLGITLMSPDALCIGNATPGRKVPMSLCNASHFCTKPATFNFNLFFHFDVDLIPRPQPFTDADVSVGIDFIPDGQTTASFSKHQSGKGIYAGAGAPLKTPFGNSFSFTTSKDGTLSVAIQMTDAATGITVTYTDNIRCTITPCNIS